MFDIGASELLVIVIVAVLVIGPKDLPLALRTAGRWIGKIRRVSAHFRSGLDTMVREAEMEDMEKKWREQNARIMAEHPGDEMVPLDSYGAQATSSDAASSSASEEGTGYDQSTQPQEPKTAPNSDEPVLPLRNPGAD